MELNARSIQPSTVAAHILQAIKFLELVFSDNFRPSNHAHLVTALAPRSPSDGSLCEADLDTYARGLSRALALVAQSLRTLSSLERPPMALMDALAFHLTDLLQHFLDTIRGHCALHPPRTKPKPTKAARPKPVDKLLTLLTKLVLDALTPLESTCGPHRTFFSGALALVLRRAGNLIYILEFGHAPSATIIQEIDADVLTLDPQAWNVAIGAAAVEARVLFPLAKKLVQMAPAFMSADGRGKQLMLDAKEKLTHTLLKSVWGEEERWPEALTRPALGGNVPVTVRSRADERFWFVGEMWRLIGWECLGR